jgi:hypothetical protein
MRRREVITLIGGAAAWLLAASLRRASFMPLLHGLKSPVSEMGGYHRGLQLDS